MKKFIPIIIVFSLGVILVAFWRDLIAEYVPRSHCMMNETWLIIAYLIANAGIAIAYFSIPYSLFKLVRGKPKLVAKSVFWQFIVFIVLCGLNHVFDVIAVFNAYYRLDMIFRVFTMIASLRTAYLLPLVVREILAMPSMEEFNGMKTELQRIKSEYEMLLDKMKSLGKP